MVCGKNRRIPYKTSLDFKSSYVPTRADKKDWSSWLDFVKYFYKHNSFKTDEVFPVFVNKMPDNRPYISPKIYDYEITALLDSGTNYSVLGAQAFCLLDKFNLPLTKCGESFVHTADGEKQWIKGCVFVPINLCGVCRIVKFLVVPSFKYGIILGSDFCKEFLLNINFKNNTWKVQC